MVSKNEVIERARETGFGDIGFTTAEPFEMQRELLLSRQEEYAWIKAAGMDLLEGTWALLHLWVQGWPY